MLLELYPNQEIRVVWGPGTVPVRVSERRDMRPSKALLDIPPQPSQAKPRRNYKRHPLRDKARHRILHHGGLFSDEKKDSQCFLTGTLPGSTGEAMEAFTHLAPYVSKIVQTYLPRALSLPASELRYIWVWELQKRGALHMHLIVQCPTVEDADRLLDEWRPVWVAALRAAAKKADCDLFERHYGGTHRDDSSVWQIKAEKPTKSVARYLSKYESKGSKGEEKYYPPRWYGISSALRADMKEYRKRNTLHRLGMISPECGVKCARIIVSSLLEEFCVGPCKEKHGYGDVGGVDCFGYKREGIGLMQVFTYIHNFLMSVGAMVIKTPLRIKKMDFGRECAALARKIERTMPEGIFESYRALLGDTMWGLMQDQKQADQNIYEQAYYAYTFLLYREKVSWTAHPLWASELNQAWNSSRERFAEILG